MNIKINLYKYLRNNVDKIVEIIYIKILKKTSNIGLVANLFELGFVRLLIIIKWIYFGFFIIMLPYIIIIGKYLFNIIQRLGKCLIDVILYITGSLSKEIIDNIWLLLILLFILIILIISFKIIKYYIKKRSKLKEERELFKEELLKKLQEQDEIINKQIKEIILKKNENIYKIKLYDKIYDVDITKIKKI